ncbi:hypothetical protein KC367_g130 [Hortaea werneckii]|nr:hypothetical protein KC367_g130 [Hortaea werneckii]
MLNATNGYLRPLSIAIAVRQFVRLDAIFVVRRESRPLGSPSTVLVLLWEAFPPTLLRFRDLDGAAVLRSVGQGIQLMERIDVLRVTGIWDSLCSASSTPETAYFNPSVVHLATNCSKSFNALGVRDSERASSGSLPKLTAGLVCSTLALLGLLQRDEQRTVPSTNLRLDLNSWNLPRSEISASRNQQHETNSDPSPTSTNHPSSIRTAGRASKELLSASLPLHCQSEVTSLACTITNSRNARHKYLQREGLLDVASVLCRSFKERDAEAVCEFLFSTV